MIYHSTPSCRYQKPSHCLQPLQQQVKLQPHLFPTNLDDRYRELLASKTPLRLEWNTFVAPAPLFRQHLDSSRLLNWAIKRLQNRHDIHEDIQKHNMQILTQDNLTFKIEITVK